MAINVEELNAEKVKLRVKRALEIVSKEKVVTNDPVVNISLRICDVIQQKKKKKVKS